jgi:hypothetical protein
LSRFFDAPMRPILQVKHRPINADIAGVGGVLSVETAVSAFVSGCAS